MMNAPVDIRLFSALQKLKGMVKMTQDAEGKVAFVGTQAKAIADAQRKAREPIVALLRKNSPRSRAHLKVVK